MFQLHDESGNMSFSQKYLNRSRKHQYNQQLTDRTDMDNQRHRYQLGTGKVSRIKSNIRGWAGDALLARVSFNELLGTCALVAFVPVALAQPDPYDSGRRDSDSRLESSQNVDDAAGKPGKTARTVIRADMPRKQTSISSLKLTVKGFRLEGRADIPAEGIEKTLSPWKGRELTFPEFEQAVHAVARYLRENGHPDAEVKVSRAQFGEGMLAIAVQGLSTAPQQAAPSVAEVSQQSMDTATPPAKPVQVAAAPPIQDITPRIHVKSFRFSGATVASNDELQKAVEQWSDKLLTLKELQLSADGVSAYLHNKGYTLAQAWIPPQRIDSGEVEISIQEGLVDAKAGNNGLTVRGGGKLVHNRVIENTLASGVHPGLPFKASDLEGALLTVNELPGIKSVRVNLTPGTLPGTTQIEALVEEGSLLSGSAWVDNHGSVYTGQNRLNALARLNSPSGYGEQYSVLANHSSRMDSFKMAAQVPAGIHGAKLGASVFKTRMDIGREMAPLNLSGQSSGVSLYASYPLVRSSMQNSIVSFNLDNKRLTNDIAGFRENDRRIDLATLAFSGDLTDTWQGKVSWGAGLTRGNLNLSRNLNYQILDYASARTAGGFGKANWNFSRVAPIYNNAAWSWALGLSGQFASKNLDGAEKFQLGGPAGVRAYPVGEAIGDAGWLANVELRRSLGATSLGNAQIFGFMDSGSITQYHSPWINTVTTGRPNNYSLTGYGIGASLGYEERGGVSVVAARKLGSNPNPTLTNTDSDGSNKSARIWIIGNIMF